MTRITPIHMVALLSLLLAGAAGAQQGPAAPEAAAVAPDAEAEASESQPGEPLDAPAGDAESPPAAPGGAGSSVGEITADDDMPAADDDSASAEAAGDEITDDAVADSDEAAEVDAEAPITVLDQVVPVADPATDETGPPAPESMSPEEELRAAFRRYSELQDAGVYDEAANAAKRVVELSIRQNGPASNDTARALSNLAIAQNEMGNHEAAAQNFAAAIDIITNNEDNLSPMLINPLTGLGRAQLKAGDAGSATVTYERAVHISHVNEGPHNIEQVPILEALAEAKLHLGEFESAKDTQDMIYALNLRHYRGQAMAMIPSLMRRAEWQRRTGYILDERATYRRIIRIVEETQGKDSLALIRPLLNLGESYFFIDTSDSNTFHAAQVATGEIYFKRAVRIAEENPEADWRVLAQTQLALGDYYNYRSEVGRARKIYREIWKLLSGDDERRDLRREMLESLTPLNEEPIPRYIAGATRQDRAESDSGLREGRIVVAYDVNDRGRVSELEIIEAQPEDFDDLRHVVIRELRTRIFRPVFFDAEPIDAPDQVYTHTFYYRQEELDKMRASSEAEG